ncbi:MAG: four helix bundle protein [Verrucomicrobia bacterium]|nr:four helix bundle protein [Verrucomicrobiota bacterium]
MATIRRFEDIEAWKKGRELRRSVYAETKRGEFARDFELKGQIRRTAISVTSNIAEGFERRGNKEFIQFLSNAKGSCGEVRDQLYVALDEEYISQTQFEFLDEMTVEVRRLIGGFMSYLQRSSIRGQKFRSYSGSE